MDYGGRCCEEVQWCWRGFTGPTTAGQSPSPHNNPNSHRQHTRCDSWRIVAAVPRPPRPLFVPFILRVFFHFAFFRTFPLFRTFSHFFVPSGLTATTDYYWQERYGLRVLSLVIISGTALGHFVCLSALAAHNKDCALRMYCDVVRFIVRPLIWSFFRRQVWPTCRF